MILRMPCPTKRKGSDNWHFRRTIPADVQRTLATLPRQQWPRNWYKTHIAISLGTADRAKAKEKCPEVAAAVERHMTALREGPKPLTVKQISALVGDLYRAFAEGLEDDPGHSAEEWRDIAEGIRAVRLGKGWLATIGIGEHAELRAADMETRLGRLADSLLARRTIVTTDASRWQLIERISIDLPKAADKLARNADGDFSPDIYAARFPVFEEAKTNANPLRSINGMADAWRDAAKARGVKSAEKMRAAVLRFTKWLGHDDVSRVTKADVLKWADERAKSGRGAATINRTDLAALKTVWAWGADRGWMEATPLDRRTRIEGRPKIRVRDEYFSAQEATAILNAALLVQPTKREALKTTAAKRWVPWLCAYSGARVTEMIQIRRQDVSNEAGSWTIRLTPEAGDIKTNQFRVVPVHQHLVAIGFLEFVKAAPEGPLFCGAGEDGTTVGPAEGVYSRIRTFIRLVVPDPNVQPNHAWRYTFKTLGLEAGIEEIVLDALCGHTAGHKGRDYTKVTLTKRIEAMRLFPRYTLA